MPSSQEVKPLLNTAGKKIRALTVLGSGEVSPFDETLKQIGHQYGPPPSPEISLPSQNKFEYVIMGTFEELDQIIWRLEQLFVQSGYFGALPVLENQDWLGNKPDWRLGLGLGC